MAKSEKKRGKAKLKMIKCGNNIRLRIIVQSKVKKQTKRETK